MNSGLIRESVTCGWFSIMWADRLKLRKKGREEGIGGSRAEREVRREPERKVWAPKSKICQVIRNMHEMMFHLLTTYRSGSKSPN